MEHLQRNWGYQSQTSTKIRHFSTSYENRRMALRSLVIKLVKRMAVCRIQHIVDILLIGNQMFKFLLKKIHWPHSRPSIYINFIKFCKAFDFVNYFTIFVIHEVHGIPGRGWYRLLWDVSGSNAECCTYPLLICYRVWVFSEKNNSMFWGWISFHVDRERSRKLSLNYYMTLIFADYIVQSIKRVWLGQQNYFSGLKIISLTFE